MCRRVLARKGQGMGGHPEQVGVTPKGDASLFSYSSPGDAGREGTVRRPLWAAQKARQLFLGPEVCQGRLRPSCAILAAFLGLPSLSGKVKSLSHLSNVPLWGDDRDANQRSTSPGRGTSWPYLSPGMRATRKPTLLLR